MLWLSHAHTHFSRNDIEHSEPTVTSLFGQHELRSHPIKQTSIYLARNRQSCQP